MENRPDIKKFIYKYNILINGKHKELGILGWRTALAHARNWKPNLFETPKRIEILNLWTGEIVSLEQAEFYAKQLAIKKLEQQKKLLNEQANSATT